MMHIITADGCVWIAVATIVGVRRSAAQKALIKLEDGGTIPSLERYEAFVERLNKTLLKAAGMGAAWDTGELDAPVAGSPMPSRSSERDRLVPQLGLNPALP